MKQEEYLARRLEITRMMRSVCSSYTIMANQILQPLDLTVTQCEVLLYLYQHPDEAEETQQLRQRLQISPAALSDTLRQLNEKGYIHYTHHGDMRKKRISLTVHALELQERLTEKMLRLKEIYFQQVTDGECEVMQEALKKIAKNIKTEMGEKPA